jgi:hypothetical protein
MNNDFKIGSKLKFKNNDNIYTVSKSLIVVSPDLTPKRIWFVNWDNGEERVFDEKIKEYEKIKDAAKEYGINERFISKCCRGIIREYKGYKWKFKDER